jgi:hypothetical protein
MDYRYIWRYTMAMYRLFWFLVLCALVYGGYRSYEANKSSIDNIISRIANKNDTDFTGTYVSPSGTFDIIEENGITAHVEGRGSTRSESAQAGDYIEGSGVVNGNTITYSHTGCTVVMTFSVNSMRADDTGGCLDGNRSFTDNYIKQ